MLQLLRQNANRCLTLVLLEVLVIGFFHRLDGELFLKSELIALSIHLALSLFWLCFYVIMRSKLKIGSFKRYDPRRIIWDLTLYIVFDYIIIHVIIWLLYGEFQLHIDEVIPLLVWVYAVNLFFDTHKHHCCHDHCE